MRGAKGVYQALPVLVSRIRSSLGLTDRDRALLLRGCGLLCVAATTLCVTERDNQEVQETLASEEQYKQETQRSTRSGASRSRAR